MIPPARVNLDLETTCDTPLDRSGVARYCEDPSLDVLCAHLRWACGDAIWRPGLPPPAVLVPGSIIAGWNVEGFDRKVWDACLTPRYGWPLSTLFTFDDSMLRAAASNLPMKLATAAKILAGGDAQKDMAGHRLMMQLCKPSAETSRSNDPRRLHTPEALARLEDYCAQDTLAEAEVARRLPPLPPMEVKAQVLDRTINDRGVPINVDRVRMLRDVAEAHRQHLREELHTATGGAVEDENKRKALAEWLVRRGVCVPAGKGATDKAAVSCYLETPGVPPDVVRVLRIQQALGKTSLAKLDAMLSSVCRDGRIRGCTQFLGATQTRRWAGRLVQWQNVARGFLGKDREYDEALALVANAVKYRSLSGLHLLYGGGVDAPDQVLDLLSSLLRTCVEAPEGYRLLDADYNAIEPRFVAWLAGCRKTLDMYCRGIDLYVEDAAVALHTTADKITKAQRNSIGKPCRIGFAYGLGGNKFESYAAQFGARLARGEGKAIISAMRSGYPAIPAFWKALDRAAMRAIQEPGRVFNAGAHIAFKQNADGHLLMRLPSGGVLWYRDARIVEKPAPWDPEVMLPCVEYAFQDQMTRQWVRGTTWGGTFTEQATQAGSRDLLLHALHTCEARDLPVVLHVHDQILALVPEEQADPKRLESAMCDLPAWAAGLPVKAEAVARRYWVK